MLEPRDEVVRARERAARERVRAVRAMAIAVRHEHLATSSAPVVRELHLDMARMHRAIELRHLTAARLHAAHAERLAGPGNGSPRFMAAIAATVGASHIGLSLNLDNRSAAVMVSSDQLANAAQDLEFALGEGPVHDVTTVGDAIVVDVASAFRRWPNFAPAVGELGVHAVVAAPLRTQNECFGVLTVFDPPNGPDPATLRAVADALVHTALLAPESADPLDVPLLADIQDAVVHQATGMVAVQLGCRAADALDVLRARAYADNQPVTAIADDVVRRRLRLG